jgi:dihydroorotate dehydrogenase (fumarate)
MDLTTKYLGLTLRSPIIVGSSGLTDSVSKIEQLEKHGAGAVVLKSIFEEEITMEYEKVVEEEAPHRYKDDFLDYFDFRLKQENIEKYINLISEAKEKVSIPVIGSINCTQSHEWPYFAKNIQKAGADALELNVFILPSNLNLTAEYIEKTYLDIIQKVKKEVNIPVVLKMSYFFSNLAHIIEKLSSTGIAGIVLFNRFYTPDIDIDKLELTATNVFSTPNELATSLRWIGIMASRVSCDLAASTGVHDGASVIKQLLAGADAVQVVSALYNKGPEYLETMLNDIQDWMKEKNYDKVNAFKGMLSQDKAQNPSLFERVQFMKYFSDRK